MKKRIHEISMLLPVFIHLFGHIDAGNCVEGSPCRAVAEGDIWELSALSPTSPNEVSIMKSLLFASAYAVLLAAVCLTIPLTAAYAEDEPPDFAGTVSCLETSLHDGGPSVVSKETEYPVELIDGRILGRWGEGKDTIYRLFGFLEEAGEYSIDPDSEIDIEQLLEDVSLNIWTMPVDAMCDYDVCLLDENFYSETGWWKLKVHKDEVKIRGISFAVLDYHFGGDIPEMSAQCTWDLKGPIASLYSLFGF